MIKENNIKNILDRPNTQKTYQSIYNNWIRDKSYKDIMDGILYNDRIKSRTKLSILKVLKKCNPELFANHSLDAIVKSIRKNVEQSDIKVWSQQEASRAMGVCKNKYPAFYPIMLLALHGGLRRGEVFGLSWKDIDFLKNRIYINHSYDGPTKSGKSRKIPMSKELEKSLLNYYNLVEGENNKLFPTINPNPILEAICKEAKVPILTFHQLRHTFATLALDSGMSPKQVQVLLGHSKVSTTLDLYWQNIHEKIDLEFLPS